jgi:hypothetical protein
LPLELKKFRNKRLQQSTDIELKLTTPVFELISPVSKILQPAIFQNEIFAALFGPFKEPDSPVFPPEAAQVSQTNLKSFYDGHDSYRAEEAGTHEEPQIEHGDQASLEGSQAAEFDENNETDYDLEPSD